MAQKQIRRQPAKRETEQVEDAPKADDAEELKRRTDELLDEIDDLMAEQDAEAFVRGYVQKGGQ